MRNNWANRQRQGQVIVFFLVLMVIGLLLATGLLTLQNHIIRDAKAGTNRQDAIYLAEAGLNYGLSSLGTGGAINANEISLGRGSFVVQDLTGSGSERQLESTGYIPNASNPTTTRVLRAKVILSSDNVQFFYGIQVDSGGVTMGNNSQLIGNIFSNGNIIGGSGTIITGEAIVAGGLTDEPTLEYSAQDSDYNFATINGNRDIAQSFTAPTSEVLNKVSVFIGKVGNPTSDLTLRLVNDNNGSPDNSDIASAAIPYNYVGATPSWIDISFDTAAGLTAGVKYWIILDYGSSSGSDYWNWRRDSADGYADNTAKYTSNWNAGNASWTAAGGDLSFRIWVGGIATRIEGVTIGDAAGGTGRANQFVNATIHGSACPNPYCLIENPIRENLPLSDGVVQDWKNAAAAGGTQTGDYSLSNSETGSLGPKKIAGNLNLDNGAILTVTGAIWVTGNVSLGNNCAVQLDPSFGPSSSVIIVDGTVNISNNCAFSGSGNSASYIMLLTTRDDPNNDVMVIDNGSSGVIYYAGKGRIRFANQATAKEATAYGISLDNNAVITYDAGLANASFTTGPGAGWSLKRGSIQEYKN